MASLLLLVFSLFPGRRCGRWLGQCDKPLWRVGRRSPGAPTHVLEPPLVSDSCRECRSGAGYPRGSAPAPSGLPARFRTRNPLSPLRDSTTVRTVFGPGDFVSRSLTRLIAKFLRMWEE